MKKVYIASSLRNEKLNREIYKKLLVAKINTFLPESIENGNHSYKPSMYIISEKCYEEIENSNVIIAVCSFGKSVSSELGYAIHDKRHNKNKTIVSLYMDFADEAMIAPYVDHNFDNIDEMVNYIASL